MFIVFQNFLRKKVLQLSIYAIQTRNRELLKEENESRIYLCLIQGFERRSLRRSFVLCFWWMFLCYFELKTRKWTRSSSSLVPLRIWPLSSSLTSNSIFLFSPLFDLLSVIVSFTGIAGRKSTVRWWRFTKRITENRSEIHWILLCLSTSMLLWWISVKIVVNWWIFVMDPFEIDEIGKRLGFQFHMFLMKFIRILAFDSFFWKREMKLCFCDFCWVVSIWMEWQWLGPFIGCQLYYWTNRNLTPGFGL